MENILEVFVNEDIKENDFMMSLPYLWIRNSLTFSQMSDDEVAVALQKVKYA